MTAGIGQPGGPEGFAGDYELGNNCYAETCSGIAFAMWNHRLHQLTGESKYADLMERTFLNNMLSSLSAEGDRHSFTAEFKDNDFGVAQLKLADDTKFSADFQPDLFGGAVTLTSDSDPVLKMIPYYLYANRGQGWMRVWLPRAVK